MLVRDGETVPGSLHARGALVARAGDRPHLARDPAGPVPELSGGDTVADAVERLRHKRASLALVRDVPGRLTGMVGLDDLLARLPHPAAS
ncbi:hypothetical protein JW613_05635 [Streptomyces smyrnaeus]|uniref:CBS domain-containing protein n=1 Tax=Streptomyces smyrnaeus TaxID=1387713 RepID=A0ABS3XR30_9ACTN|nr:hypothetical protein [Streptomyces smyrnaeus]